MKKIFLFLFVLVMVQIYFSSCTKEVFTTDGADKLAFSKDTLRFDTVFTKVGSATRQFKVYNRSDKWIKIDKIYLKEGVLSRFNLNIDGVSGDAQQNIEIAPNDSMYIFAEVTINPNQSVSSSPFILNEALVFETNGNTQSVILEAWGQNANYIPSRFGAANASQITEDQVWDDPKPYVIYGIFYVNGCQLTIPAGAKIYVHGGLVKNPKLNDNRPFNDGLIAMVNGGRLKINGTEAKPVVIQSDRLEKEFEDAPGQWGAIVYDKGSVGNVVNYAVIKNCIVGIFVDSLAEVSLKNTKIYNTSGSAILGRHAKITAQNCLFRRNYATSVSLNLGGEYVFDYCTLANYGADATALSLGNVACLRKDANGNCIQKAVNTMNAKFRNCIVFGGRPDEIDLIQDKTAAFNVQFENCVVRVKDILKPTAYPNFLTENCKDCVNGTGTSALFLRDNPKLKNDPKLIGILDDYHLDTLSIADGKGKFLQGIDKDLDGVLRNSSIPDVGCYERLK